MTILAIANQKVGAGKTTTAVNLAAALAESEERVLFVDLDAQLSTSRWLDGALTEGAGTVLDAFDGSGSLAEAVVPSSASGVDLIPAAPLLAGVERTTAAHAARNTYSARG